MCLETSAMPHIGDFVDQSIQPPLSNTFFQSLGSRCGRHETLPLFSFGSIMQQHLHVPGYSTLYLVEPPLVQGQCQNTFEILHGEYVLTPKLSFSLVFTPYWVPFFFVLEISYPVIYKRGLSVDQLHENLHRKHFRFHIVPDRSINLARAAGHCYAAKQGPVTRPFC